MTDNSLTSGTLQGATLAPDLLREVEGAAARAKARLLGLQRDDGHWCALLETDTSITSDWLLTCRHLGRVDEARERKVLNYLSRRQEADGGWRIHPRGATSHDTTIKAYAAMKAAGVGADDPRLVRARRVILENGGVETSATFTKIQLAILGEISWDAIPCIPPEMMLLPRSAPFNVYEMSYWCRTIMVPLTIVQAIRRRGHLPPDRGVPELFVTSQGRRRESLERGADWFSWRRLFYLLDRALKGLEPMSPRAMRRVSLRVAERWVLERLEDSDGLGAIIPAMLNTVSALHALGYAPEHPVVQKAWRDLDGLGVETADEYWMQPCLSPVWDTALAGIALIEAGLPPEDARVASAASWLMARRVTRSGDWRVKVRHAPASAWAFQYRNDHYPDVDDTAVVVQMLRRAGVDDDERRRAVDSATEWCRALQSRNGGWGAFDRNNDRLLLQHVPFADHGALLDAPVPDLTGRVLELLGDAGGRKEDPAVARGLAYLRREQEDSGAWFGRWGVNYLYGTWSVLEALSAVELAPDDPMVAAAVRWLENVQNPDGGWGESPDSYVDSGLMARGESTPSQTAWGLLGLVAAGRADTPAAHRAAERLVRTQSPDGGWEETDFTGTGFPGVLYLRYHLYPLTFPLLALARYQRGNRLVATTTTSR